MSIRLNSVRLQLAVTVTALFGGALIASAQSATPPNSASGQTVAQGAGQTASQGTGQGATQSTSQQGAQAQKPSNPPVAQPAAEVDQSPYGGNFDFYVEGMGVWPNGAILNSVPTSNTNTGGVGAGMRYHLTDWLAGEANYTHFSFTENYGSVFTENARADEFAGGVVITVPTESRLKPFVLGDFGMIRFAPTTAGGNTPGAVDQSKFCIVYGGGLDVQVKKHISIRVEYRGVLYRVPDFGLVVISDWNHIAEPAIGLAFHF